MSKRTKKVEIVSRDSQVVAEPFPYSSWHIASVACILAVSTFFVYWHTLSYQFQFDDLANISKHFQIRHHTFWDLFFSGTRWISYWLNAVYHSLINFNPFWYRLGDVIIHAINGQLVFFILLFSLSRMPASSLAKKYSLLIAAATAALFLLHPVQSQTVCYVIQGQLEGLATLCILLIMGCFSWYAQTSRKLIAVLLFVSAFLATGTKEIVIITPLLLVLFDWFFIAQGSWQSLKQRLFMHGAVSTFILVCYAYLLRPTFFIEVLSGSMTAHNNQGNVITQSHGVVITPFMWVISQFKVVLHYLMIFVWPVNISVEYDWKLVAHPFALDCIVPFAILCAIAALIWFLLKQQSSHMGAFGLLWFFISMAPRTSIIPSSELIADYKTYVGSLGIMFVLVLALTWLYDWCVSRMSVLSHHRMAWIAPCMLMGVLGMSLSYATWQRSMVWSSGVVFWADLVAKAPGKARVHNNYGVELSGNARYEESIVAFKRAIELDPLYFDPLNNMAVSYSHLNNIDEAIKVLEKSLKINPMFPEGYNNLAAMYKKKGNNDLSEKALLHAIKLRPHYGKAWYNLGLLYVDQQKIEKAWECFKTCCFKADLDEAIGFNAYAKACIQLKKYEDAIDAYKRILTLSPQDEEAYFNLANAYFLAKKYEQALEMYHHLAQRHPDDPRIVINIGESYFEMGQPANALTYFEKLEPYKQNIPSICVRVARCYKALHEYDKARSVLGELKYIECSAGVKKEAHELFKTLA